VQFSETRYKLQQLFSSRLVKQTSKLSEVLEGTSIQAYTVDSGIVRVFFLVLLLKQTIFLQSQKKKMLG